jgi:hypothetical protein
MSVWVFICGSEKSHVPPASHAKPFSHFVTASALAGRRTSVIVFKSIYSKGTRKSYLSRLQKLNYQAALYSFLIRGIDHSS